MELNLDVEVLNMMDFNAQAENELNDNNGIDAPRLPEVLSKLDFVLYPLPEHTELCHYCHVSRRDMAHTDILTPIPSKDEIMFKAKDHLKNYHRGMFIEWERELV